MPGIWGEKVEEGFININSGAGLQPAKIQETRGSQATSLTCIFITHRGEL